MNTCVNACAYVRVCVCRTRKSQTVKTGYSKCVCVRFTLWSFHLVLMQCENLEAVKLSLCNYIAYHTDLLHLIVWVAQKRIEKSVIVSFLFGIPTDDLVIKCIYRAIVYYLDRLIETKCKSNVVWILEPKCQKQIRVSWLVRLFVSTGFRYNKIMIFITIIIHVLVRSSVWNSQTDHFDPGGFIYTIHN